MSLHKVSSHASLRIDKVKIKSTLTCKEQVCVCVCECVCMCVGEFILVHMCGYVMVLMLVRLDRWLHV